MAHAMNGAVSAERLLDDSQMYRLVAEHLRDLQARRAEQAERAGDDAWFSGGGGGIDV